MALITFSKPDIPIPVKPLPIIIINKFFPSILPNCIGRILKGNSVPASIWADMDQKDWKRWAFIKFDEEKFKWNRNLHKNGWVQHETKELDISKKYLQYNLRRGLSGFAELTSEFNFTKAVMELNSGIHYVKK